MGINTTVSWDVTVHSLAGTGSDFVWNVGLYLPHYVVVYSRKPELSSFLQCICYALKLRYEPRTYQTQNRSATRYTYWGSHSRSWRFKFSGCDAIPPDELFLMFERIKVPESSGSCSSRSCFTLKMNALWSLDTSGGIIHPLTHCHIPRWSQCSTAMRFSRFFKVLSEKLQKN